MNSLHLRERSIGAQLSKMIGCIFGRVSIVVVVEEYVKRFVCQFCVNSADVSSNSWVRISVRIGRH
jgi:hypothetical protein